MTDTVAQAALDRAFDEKNLVLLYQPIHDARTRVIVAAEALLRQRRQSGEIREAHIISEAAEEGSTGDLFTLDSWTMRTACDDAKHWQSFARVALNVNLPPREFEEGGVVAKVSRFAGNCRLNLELTETQTIEDTKSTAAFLRDVKSLGVGLWLDDFGTGHSTMEHLLDFPIDGIKLAATFVKGVPGDERSSAIVRSLIALAHELKLQVIAEGIEHEEQMEFLVAHACDFVQGFLLSRPMPRDDFEALLRR
jgi:EAL domain-containing protein (putative c-di-GMP-specific phosphodiesterase class I)